MAEPDPDDAPAPTGLRKLPWPARVAGVLLLRGLVLLCGPLGGFLSLVSDQMLRNSVIAGRPDLGMPDWREVGPRAMTPQEISDVVAWMVARRVPFPGPPHPPEHAAAGL